ncbi:MBL fold metallo-hydrolase [Dysgonomonas sp. 511]|uniref:MBL fold metallo-hydrolase n=1 Tax=Dysgonomonas sp. 511 TaxID=2302930 RepID=UPI0013D277C7|nr:MBL fold metallo-hydrolase [Dysgonomonas sp. 511]NDV79469.1 MBL fold metallo-hydrolase [Dysgonomonas sp. 511]
MELTYIYHSGFALEGKNFIIIIDYYKDSSDDGKHGIVHERLLDSDKQIYVLVTHSHHDHFNKEVLEWNGNSKDIVYILSKDIYENKLVRPDIGFCLNKSEIYKDDNIYIKAFGSTDLGISFYIEAEGKSIFHAGDLNNWHWNEESTEDEIKEAEDFYANELNLVADNVKHLDLAMFPVDARLGKDYMKGAGQFLERIKTDTFVPMHFGEGYKQAAAFAPIAERCGSRFFDIRHKGQSIEF